MSKDHYLPRLVIKNFTDSSGKIYFYSKQDKKIYGPFNHYNQLQERNFYSKKSINELKKIFQHISINPLFRKKDLNLDKNIELFLERPAGKIFSKIIKELLNGNLPKISNEDFNLIKEYFIIQYLRTPMQKEISKKVHEKSLKLPVDIRDIIMEQEHKREINPKEFINKRFPYLNSKQRREKVNQFKKILKKNPDFIKNIRNSQKTEEILEEEIKKSEEKLEIIRTSPDKHSSEILDFNLRNSFSKRIDLDNRNIKFLINNTKIPFTLSDTGIMIICWDYEIKKELHLYLPIHSKVLIEFSQDSERMKLVDEDFVKEINSLSENDSLIRIYSSDNKALIF